MKRVFPFLVLLLMPAAALADGMVFRPIAVAANVSIPDQRALIHFTNGTERLVIGNCCWIAGIVDSVLTVVRSSDAAGCSDRQPSC